MASSDGSCELNLVDRLFVLLDGLQGNPSLSLYWLSLDAPLERAALEAALGEVVARVPVLRSTIAWRLGRPVRAPRPVDTARALAWGAGGDEEASAFFRQPFDLAADPPFRLLVQPHGAGCRLVAAIHHSATDAMGGYFFLDRLAAHYAARLAGTEAPVWPTERPRARYRRYWRELPPAKRLGGWVRALLALRELSEAAPACATFADQGPPARGVFAWRAVELPAELVGGLKDWAKAHGGTLGDALLAAVALAGLATWPQEAARPVVAMVPSNLRDGPPTAVENWVAEVPVVLAPEALGSLADALAATTTATVAARDRTRAFLRVAERVFASWLPPGLFRRAVARHLDRVPNRSMTLVFSNLGLMDGLPGDFGPARVLAVGGSPPLTMPPGLAVVPATRGGRLWLTLAWLEPAVSAAAIDRFVGELAEVIRAAGDHPPPACGHPRTSKAGEK